MIFLIFLYFVCATLHVRLLDDDIAIPVMILSLPAMQ